jgi:hypothetical protein
VCCPPSLVIASSAVNHKVTDGSEVKNDETRHVMRVMGHFGKMRSGDPPVVKNKLKLFQSFYSCTTILVVKFFLKKCVDILKITKKFSKM